MLEIYKGIKIEENVVIVEKQNEEHQGYLVCKSNKNQLDSALNWAKCFMPVLDQDGNKIKEQINGYTRCKYQEFDGVVHEYKNGQFAFSLSESANCSSQGGKLSFWNCTISAPDGKEFLIGINSECLIQLLKHNTFINGVCQSKVWLGRIKNNVGAFTENMEEFEQGKKDKAIREAKKTSKYDVGAILIPSNKVYLGKFFKTFDIWSEASYYGFRSNKVYKQIVNIYSKPLTRYLYKDHDLLEPSMEPTIHEHNFTASKCAGVLSEETFEVDLPTLWYNTKKYLEQSKYGQPFYIDFIAHCQNSCFDSVRMPDAYELMRHQYLFDQNSLVSLADFNEDYVGFLKEYFDKYKIPYVIDADEDELERRNYRKY